MTQFFAVATGNWSSTSTWSLSSGGAAGAGPPTAADTATLNAASGAITVTVDGTSGSPSLCQSLVCTGYTGTLAFGSSGTMTVGNSGGGSWTLASGMTISGTGGVLNLVSTTTGNTITTAGKSLPFTSVSLSGSGGGYTMQDAWTFSNTNLTITITLGSTGSFNTNNNNISTWNNMTFNSGTITLGTSTLNGGSFGSLSIASSGVTLSAASSTMDLQGLNCHSGTYTFGTVNIALDTSGSTASSFVNFPKVMSGTLTFSSLNVSTTAGNGSVTGYLLIFGSHTITGALTLAGLNTTARLFLVGSGISGNLIANGSGTATITANGTITASNVNFRNIVGAGSASWNLSAITGLSGDGGGNSGITLTSPINCYYKTSTTSGNTYFASKWFTTSGGSTSARVPLPQDTAILDANSCSSAGTTIAFTDASYFGPTDFSAITNTTAVQLPVGSALFFGDFKLASTPTFSAPTTISIFMPTPGGMTITSAGKSWGPIRSFGQGNNLTLADAFSSTSGTFFIESTNLTSNSSITCVNFSLNTNTVNSACTITLGGNLVTTTSGAAGSQLGVNSGHTTTVVMNGNTITTSGTGQFTISGSTVFSGSGTINFSGTGSLINQNVGVNFSNINFTITDTSATTKTFAGVGLTYGNMTVSGAASNGTVTFTGGNTFGIFTLNPNCSIILPASTTTTCTKFVARGSSGNLVTITSSSSGTQATLSQASGIVACDWLSLKDSKATGGATFYAGSDSTNVSNNTGWSFTMANYPITAAESTYSYIGQSGTTFGIGMPAATSSYTYTGNAVNFGIGMPAATSSYTYTGGANTTITKQKKITSTQGSYTYTGYTTVFAITVLMTANNGSYTYTGGTNNNLYYGRNIIPVSGTYSLTGNAATLLKTKIITAATSTYSYVGQTGTTFGIGMPALKGLYNYSGGSGTTILSAKLINPAYGTYSYTGGINTQIIYGIVMFPDFGTYSYTGYSVVLGETIFPASGSYSLTGESTILRWAHMIDSNIGFYSYVGATGTTFGEAMFPAYGSYNVSGQSASFFHNRLINSAYGIYSYTGESITILLSRILNLPHGNYASNGIDQTLLHTRLLPAAYGSLALSGHSTTILINRFITLTKGQYSLIGGTNNEVLRGKKIFPRSAVYSLSAGDTEIIAQRKLSISYGSYSLTGYNANIRNARKIVAASNDYTVNGESATLLHDRIILIPNKNFTVIGYQSSITKGSVIFTSNGTYSLTGYNITMPRTYRLAARYGYYFKFGYDDNVLRGRVMVANNGSYTEIGYDTQPRALTHAGINVIAEYLPR